MKSDIGWHIKWVIRWLALGIFAYFLVAVSIYRLNPDKIKLDVASNECTLPFVYLLDGGVYKDTDNGVIVSNKVCKGEFIREYYSTNNSLYMKSLIDTKKGFEFRYFIDISLVFLIYVIAIYALLRVVYLLINRVKK